MRLLRHGETIFKPVYDHSDGAFGPPEFVTPTSIMLVHGRLRRAAVESARGDAAGADVLSLVLTYYLVKVMALVLKDEQRRQDAAETAGRRGDAATFPKVTVTIVLHATRNAVAADEPQRCRGVATRFLLPSSKVSHAVIGIRLARRKATS